MKTQLKILLLILSIVLTACGAEPVVIDKVDLSNVYTAAASTISAQLVIPEQTAIPTMYATPTLLSLPTTIPVTPATQSLVSYSSASTANGCNNAIFISDVTIADGTVLAPGESFVKTWKFQNSGSCAWSEDYPLTFVSGNDMDGEATEIGLEVSVGATGNVSVSLVAPSTDGTYTGYWRLADDDGNVFGQTVYAMIVVSGDASTLTPTATPTSPSSATETSLPTSVPSSTSTATPTSIPTEASAESS